MNNLYWMIAGVVLGYFFGKGMDRIGDWRLKRRDRKIEQEQAELQKEAERLSFEGINAADMLHYNPGKYFTNRIIDLVNFGYYCASSLLWAAVFLALRDTTYSMPELVGANVRGILLAFCGYMAVRAMNRARRIRYTLLFVPHCIDIVDGIHAKRRQNKGDSVDDEVADNPAEK